MQELRLVAVSEDGSYAVLVVPGRSGRFALPIDERLRTVARGQFSRLAQYEIEVESPLRPKEIQDRIRAGETAEEIADAAGLPVDRIRRFEGPVLAEREFRAQEAQRATVRSRGESGPGPRLGEIVAERLAATGAAADEAEWDSRKRQDGSWQVQLAYTLAGRMHLAEWVYDPRSKHVTPADDEAVRLCLAESEWPEPGPEPRQAVTATVTPIGSRASAAGGHQGGADQRGHSDWPSGRGIVHPSRQGPHPLAVGGHGQSPGAGQSGAAAMPAERGSGERAPAAAARVAAPAGRDGGPAAGELAAPGTAKAGRGPAAGGRPGAAAPAGPATAAEPGSTGQVPAAPEGDSPAPARPAKRAGGRSRRSSVPSWDEIMFGNSRQPD